MAAAFSMSELGSRDPTKIQTLSSLVYNHLPVSEGKRKRDRGKYRLVKFATRGEEKCAGSLSSVRVSEVSHRLRVETTEKGSTHVHSTDHGSTTRVRLSIRPEERTTLNGGERNKYAAIKQVVYGVTPWRNHSKSTHPEQARTPQGFFYRLGFFIGQVVPRQPYWSTRRSGSCVFGSAAGTCVVDSTEGGASEGPHPATRSHWTARGVSSRGIDVAGRKQIGSDVRGMAMRQASCRGGERTAKKLL
ncbi:uncharacterized protein LOC134206174 [Armigeres subalbatus]|uniref:uncharacterized protein LOC134206174 n=1 Tax=Armigeres subalbatus TaxID=124917 RepID=UPI002ED50D59